MDWTSLQQFLDRLEWTTLALPAVLLLFIGNKVVEEHPRPRTAANRIIGLVFLCLLAFQMHSHWPVHGDMLTEILLRSLVLSGLMLGCAWIVAPGLFSLCEYTIAAPIRKVAGWGAALVGSVFWVLVSPVRFVTEQNARRKQATEQEHLRREGESYAKHQATAQKRREDARAACELLYSLCAPEIKDRFPKTAFDDFFQKYLGDGHPPDFVEERAEQLKSIIEQHRTKIEPPEEQKTLEELAQWYQNVREQILHQKIEDKYKNAQIAQLNVRYQRLVQELLEEMKP